MDCSSDDTEEFLNHSDSEDGFGGKNEESPPVDKKLKKGPVPKEPLLVPIYRALKRLVKDNHSAVTENPVVMNAVKELNFFCVEDMILSTDIMVTVEGMGQLSFPLDKKTVNLMIELSSKAKFGMGKDTLLDTNIRDTQMIPASKLQVEIKNPSLNDILNRIGVGLNINSDSRLILHLHNLLIYGPGQFFKKHTDSEKVENMIGTFIVILPSPHQGGELIIEHNNKKHMVLGSKHPDIIKCVAFYSDCVHEIKEVTDGYRVALTYNIVLQPPVSSDIQHVGDVNERLATAVKRFFDEGRVKLVFGLNHSYSQKSLKWNLMKGEDRAVANALLSVAKKQGRVACLALGKFYEIYDVEDKYEDEEPDFIDEEKELKFWIDENNLEFKSDEFHDTNIGNDEFCSTKEIKDLCRPYKTKASGPTGNEGMTEELWYRRGCIVLWSSKWVLVHGFKQELKALHKLTKQDGMQKILLENVDKAGEDFVQPEIWLESSVADMLLDIIIYLNDIGKAIMVLEKLSQHLLQEDRIDWLVKLERHFGDEVWQKIVKYWKDNGSGWYGVVSKAHTYIEKYINHTGELFKSIVIDNILEEAVIRLTTQKHHLSYVYGRINQGEVDKIHKIIEISSKLSKLDYVNRLIDFVISVFPAVSQGELYCKLEKANYFAMYSNLKDSAESAIRMRLSELKEPQDWALYNKYDCKCKKCKPFREFFESKSLKKLTILATKTLKEHVQEVIWHYEKYDYEDYDGSYKIAFKRNARKFDITFEKLPKLQKDRQKLKDDLNTYLEEIQNTKPVMFIKVEENHEDITDEIHDPLETSTSVKKEEFICKVEDMKFEIDSAPGENDLCSEVQSKRIKKENN